MDAKKMIRDFYQHFQKMDLDALLLLFAPNAKVESPALGKKEAQVFYRELFSKSKKYKVHIKDIFVNPENPNRLAVFVDFKWESKMGDNLAFDGIVIFELNQQGKIQLVQSIYDAQFARDALRKAS